LPLFFYRRELIRNKIIIYALFDDGVQSVYNSFAKDEDVEVYSFGIQEKPTVIQCDLSNIYSFYERIKDFPKPDIIFANPPCETFSISTRGSYMSGRTGNIYYYEDGTPIMDYNDWCTSSSIIVRRLKKDKLSYFKKLTEKRLLHEQLHENTEHIIKYFGVPFAIENPAQSICFKKYYQNDTGLLEVPFYYDAVTYYSAYDPEFTLKPTRIRSGFPLSLLGAPKYVTKQSLKEIHDYNIKSAMPRRLIRSIIGQLLKIEL
jgi:hypothetical protein